MTLPEAIEILERHRRWLLNDYFVSMPEPKELREAIEKVLHAAMCYEITNTMINVSYQTK